MQEFEHVFGLLWRKRLETALHVTNADCLSELKRMYDGYHFSNSKDGMYNPYSLLHCFDENRFGNFWAEREFGSNFSCDKLGKQAERLRRTPTFLINKLKESHFDVRKFTEETKLSESAIKDYRPENINPRPFLYRNGFLTIKEWNRRQNSYTLCIPNDEVRGYILNVAQALET